MKLIPIMKLPLAPDLSAPSAPSSCSSQTRERNQCLHHSYRSDCDSLERSNRSSQRQSDTRAKFVFHAYRYSRARVPACYLSAQHVLTRTSKEFRFIYSLSAQKMFPRSPKGYSVVSTPTKALQA